MRVYLTKKLNNWKKKLEEMLSMYEQAFKLYPTNMDFPKSLISYYDIKDEKAKKESILIVSFIEIKNF